MPTPPEFSIQTLYEHWLNATTTLLAYPWQLFETHYQAGLKIMEATLGGVSRSPDVQSETNEVQRLERMVAERVSQGLAPPREVYQAPYRAQIDWGKFPAWVRPNDPELFEGSGHEG